LQKQKDGMATYDQGKVETSRQSRRTIVSKEKVIWASVRKKGAYVYARSKRGFSAASLDFHASEKVRKGGAHVNGGGSREDEKSGKLVK